MKQSCTLLLVLLLSALNSLAAPAENKVKVQYPISLHLRATRECELSTRATLVLYEEYAAVIPEGQAEEWYSPELSKNDVVVLPANTDTIVVKAARKSGFRTIEAHSPVNSAELTHVGNNKAECSTPDAAMTSADVARQQRREEMQSHMYSVNDRDVIPPKPLAEEEFADALGASGKDPEPKRTHGAVWAAFSVGIDGVVYDSKIVASLDPVHDARTIAAVKQWRFLPARKLGLPVPVRLEVEVRFKDIKTH